MHQGGNLEARRHHTSDLGRLLRVNMPGGKKQVQVYRKDDQVLVYSNSKASWVQGVVAETYDVVFPVFDAVSGLTHQFPPGSLKIVFDAVPGSSVGTKYLTPSEVHRVVRDFHPSPIQTEGTFGEDAASRSSSGATASAILQDGSATGEQVAQTCGRSEGGALTL